MKASPPGVGGFLQKTHWLLMKQLLRKASGNAKTQLTGFIYFLVFNLSYI